MREQRWIIVILAGLLAIGSAIDHLTSIPERVQFHSEGLRFDYPRSFIAVDESLYSGGRLSAFRESYTLFQAAASPRLRIEVLITEQPEYNNMVAMLALRRATRYGTSLFEDEQTIRNVGGRDWHRSTFAYPFQPSEVGAPVVVRGIEYAAIEGDRLVSVTVYGSMREVEPLAEMIEEKLELTDPELL